MNNYSSMLMYEEYLTMDKVNMIIIDFGTKFTKVGYSQESEPREIIPSLQLYDYDRFLLASLDNNQNYDNINKYKRIINKEFTNEIEVFINNIIFNVLQLQKKRKEKSYHCLLSFNFMAQLDDVIDIFINKLLDTQIITVVKVLNSNELPLFTSGFMTGIIVNLGHNSSNIIPIINSCVYRRAVQDINHISLNFEKYLLHRIIEENCINPIKNKQSQNKDELSKSIIPFLNELVTKSICVVSRTLFKEFEIQENAFKDDYNKIDNYKNINPIMISLYTRIKLGEKFFHEDNNLAERILNCLINTPIENRLNLSKNIILSGGLGMSFGLYKRLQEELINQIENNEKYECLKVLKDKINIHKILFPRNCLSWIGGSLLSNLDKITYEHNTIHREEIINREDDENVLPKSTTLSTILAKFK